MKKMLLATILAIVCVTSAVAGEVDTQSDRTPPTFEEKKAEILSHLKEKITRDQAEQSCVQGAKSHDDLKTCREKFRHERREERMERRGERDERRNEPPARN